jgi:hypothetical protein
VDWAVATLEDEVKLTRKAVKKEYQVSNIGNRYSQPYKRSCH